MIQSYTQTTYETCLACCLLQAVDQVKKTEITQDVELACINHSMKFSKEDFVLGHLDFIANQFNVPIKRIVDNKAFFNFVKKISSSKKITTEVHDVNLKLIDQLLSEGKKPIAYIDSYYLFGITHYPHFVTVLGKKEGGYNIFDTWDGEEKLIESKTFSKAISSLRNHLKFCPQILLIG